MRQCLRRHLPVLVLLLAASASAWAGAAVEFVDSASARAEGSGGTVVYPVTIRFTGMTGPCTVAYRVHIASGDTATAADLTLVASGITPTIRSDSTFDIQVVINPDLVIEPDETFTVTLSDPVGPDFALGAKTTHRAMLINDETSVSLMARAGTYCAIPGGRTQAITIGIGAAVPFPVHVPLVVAADPPSQLIGAPGGRVTIPAGDTEASFRVAFPTDPIPRDADPFIDTTPLTVTLGQPVNAVLGNLASATVLRVHHQAPLAVQVDGASYVGPIAAQLGGNLELLVYNGMPPYTMTAVHGGFSPGAVNHCRDFSGNFANWSPSQDFLIAPNQAGSAQFTVTDADGHSATVVLTVTAPLPPIAASVPPLPLSFGKDIVYSAISPGSWEGVARLRAALAGRSEAEAKAYAWDATIQAYVQFPAEPAGGITPGTGLFIATRVDLGLDVLTGTPAPTPHGMLLLPGWNFIGIPITDDAGPLTHVFDNLLLEDGGGSDVFGPAREALIGTGAWLWNGAAYELVAGAATPLATGRGYWIRNASDEDETLALTRLDGAVPDQAADADAGGRAYATRDVGSPPAPPSSGAKATGGGCGGGGAVAVLGLTLLAFTRRRLA